MQSNDAQEGMAEEAFLVMKMLMECGLSQPHALVEGWSVICTLVQIQQPDPLEQVREARRHFRHAADLLKDDQSKQGHEAVQDLYSQKISPEFQRGKKRKKGYEVIPDEFERWDE